MVILQLALSYVSSDADYAQRLAADLCSAGAEVTDAAAGSADGADGQSAEPADAIITLLSPEALAEQSALEAMRDARSRYQRGELAALLAVTARPLGGRELPPGWERIPTIDATGDYAIALQAIIAALQERLPTIAMRRASAMTGEAADGDSERDGASQAWLARALRRPPAQPAQPAGNTNAHSAVVSRRALVIGTATAAVAVGVAGAAVWLRGRTAPQRSGERRWYFLTGGFDGSSSPVVADGTVYVGSSDKNLYAVDALTGALRWQAMLGVGISTPSIAGGMLYAVTRSGYLSALDAKTGARRWRLQVGVGAPAPTVANGAVYIISGAKSLYALDAATGATQRKYQTPPLTSTVPPKVVDGAIYVTTSENKLLTLDEGTGATRWSAQLSLAIFTPAIDTQFVYVASSEFTLKALDAATGKVHWSTTTVGQISSAPVVAGGAVYVTSQAAPLQALAATTSAPLWATQANGFAFSPAVSDAAVCFVSAPNEISAVSAANGALRWQFQTSGAIAGAPATASGLVYATSTDTALYAIND